MYTVRSKLQYSIMHLLTMFLAGVLLLRFSEASSPKGEKSIMVMAASSLTNVLPEVAAAWKSQGGYDVKFNFESTSRLAQQIVAGAPVDIFFSADSEWMSYLGGRGMINTASRTALLSNRIVLIVSSDSTFAPSSPGEISSPRLKHLALAGEFVPAGKFARAALKSEGVLEKVQEKIVNADNVRAALQWVAKKEAEAGIVFQTDAKVEPRVKVTFVFPEASHPKIEYPVAVVKGSKNSEAAIQFLKFCQGNKAKKIFEAAGFTVLTK